MNGCPLARELLHAIPLPALRALVAAHTKKPCRAKTREALEAALVAAGPSMSLPARQLDLLSSSDGRAALLAGARALEVDMSGWPREATAAELAAFVVTGAAKDRALRTLIEAVSYALCRREPASPMRRYVAENAGGAQIAQVTKAHLTTLAKRLEAANLELRSAGGKVDVRLVSATPSGDLIVLDVIRPEPVTSALVRGAKGELVTSRQVPLHVDRLVLDSRAPSPATKATPGRVVLTVSTTARELLGAYRQAIGECLFDAPPLFTRSRPLSLRTLQRMGRIALDVRKSGVPRLKSARMVHALWDPGFEETLSASGRDVLLAIEREELPLQGLLVAVRIRLDFIGGDTVDVTLRVPNVVHWDPSPHDAEVLQFLRGLHLDDDPPLDYLALAPFDLPAWRWREVLGDAGFEALLARNLFTRSTTRALAHPDVPSAGRVSLAFPLKRSGYYVVPEEGLDVAPWVADDDALVTYRLDVLALARTMAAEAGLSGEAPQLIERGTLIDLGERVIGRARVRAFWVVGVRSGKGLRERLLALSAGAHPVLLAPATYRVDEGIAQVELGSLVGPFAPLVVGMARALKLEASLDAWTRAPAGTRIAVDKATEQTWLDGLELTLVVDSARRLARVLAEEDGAPLPSKVCDRRLSKAAGDGASKQAKLYFVSGARETFVRAGREPPADLERIIEGTRKGYRLTVKGWVG